MFISVQVTFHRGNGLRPSSGLILMTLGSLVYRIQDTDEYSIHNHRNDQVPFEDSDHCVPNSVVSTAINNNPLGTSDVQVNFSGIRRFIRSHQKLKTDFRNLNFRFACVGYENWN